jgi:hypothetical protein
MDFGWLWKDLFTRIIRALLALVGGAALTLLRKKDVTWAKPILYGLVGTACIFAILLMATMYFSPTERTIPSGFLAPWPDAISCTFVEPGADRAADIRSTGIFWLGGRSPARRNIGSVVSYILVGGQMVDDTWSHKGKMERNYYPHQLLFKENGDLLDPTTLAPDFDSQDGHIKMYIRAFLPGINCTGGSKDFSMKEILRTGHGFKVAQVLK